MADEGEKCSLSSKKRKKRCRFFLTQRGCRFGDECQFWHFKDVAIGGALENESKNVEATSNESPSQSQVTCPKSESEKQKEQMDAVEVHYVQEKKDEVANCEVKLHRETLEKSENNILERSDDLAAGGAIAEPSADNTDSKVKGQNRRKQKPLCRYFMTKKGCSRGEACKFSHAKLLKQNENSASTKLETKDKPLSLNKKAASDNDTEKQSQRDLQKNLCGNMEETRDKTNQIGQSDMLKASSRLGQPIRTGPHQFVNKPIVATAAKLSLLDDLQLEKLRKTEIQQIHRRFGGQGKLKVIREEQDAVFEIFFASSDPDWVRSRKRFLDTFNPGHFISM